MPDSDDDDAMKPRLRRIPLPADALLGRRLRALRLAAGMTQGQLGKKVGLTFQQIQKYENGRNRVSAGRLQTLAALMGVSVAYFFEGQSRPKDLSARNAAAAPSDSRFEVTKDVLELNRAFAGIAAASLRRRIVRLVEAVAAIASPAKDAIF